MATDVGSAAFETVGRWWLPESEENKVGGTLHFDPAEGSELSLIGNLRRLDEGGDTTEGEGIVKRVYTGDSMERSGTYPRIHGEAGGEAFTLDDCFRTKIVGGLIGLASEETIYVGRVLKGACFDTNEEVVADSVSFGIRYLNEWTCESGVSVDLIFNEPPDSAGSVPRVAIEGNDLAVRTTDLDDGLKLELVHHVVTNGPGNEKSISDFFAIRLRSGQPMSMSDSIEVASDSQDLLSIATGRTASFDGVHLFPPGLNQVFPGSKGIPMSVELLVPWFAQKGPPTEKAPWRHEMFFAFPDLGGLDGIQTWMAAATRHRAALGRVMSTKYPQRSFISDNLLSRTAALEAFDTTRSGFTWSKFETRIEGCAGLAG